MLLASSHTINSANYFELDSKGYVSGANRIVAFGIISTVAQTISIDWDRSNPGTVTSTQALTANVNTTVSHTFTGGFTGSKTIRITCPQPSKISYFTTFAGAGLNQDASAQPSNLGYFNNLLTFYPAGSKLTSLDLKPMFKLQNLYLSSTADYGTNYAGFGPQTYSDGSGGIPTLNLLLSPYLKVVKAHGCGVTSLTVPKNNNMTLLNVIGNNLGTTFDWLSSSLTSLYVASSSLDATKLPLSLIPASVVNLLLGTGNNAVFLSTGASDNYYPSCDISHLTSVVYCAVNKCSISGTLTLPSANTMTTLVCNENSITDFSHVSTALTGLYAYGNLLTSSVISQMTACTNLQQVRLGYSALALGQGTSPALGTNIDFSGLTALTYLDVSRCGFSGSLTLPSTDHITSLIVSNNSGLTSLNRIPTTVTILYLTATALTSIPTLPTGLTDFRLGSMTGASTYNVDLSGNTSTFSAIVLSSTSSGKVTGLTLPSTSGITVNNFVINGNDQLTSISNLSNCNFPDTGSQFYAYNCALDMTFPLGASPYGIKMRNIQIQQNDMSLTNVNATIDNLYSNRTNFNNTVSKSLSIGSSASKHQARPDGLYQAPSGFSYGSSDGTPASHMEKVWVLVNQTDDGVSSPTGTKKYKWSISVSAYNTVSTLLNDSGNLRVQLSSSTVIQRSVGQRITITNSTEASYNDTWTIISKVSNSDYTLSATYVTNTATGQIAS